MADRRTVLAIVAAVVLATSVSGPAGAIAPGPAIDLGQPAIAGDNPLADGEAADRVTVTDHGDAAFVYHLPDAGTRTDAVAIPLSIQQHRTALTVFGGAEAPLPAHTTGGAGSLAITATPERATSDADVRLERPDGLEDLDASVDVAITEETAATAFDLTGTVAEDRAVGGIANSSGTTTWTATTVRSTGEFRTTVPGGNDSPLALDERRELHVTQEGDRYAIEADERRHVGAWERERWETREDARQSLQARYDELAIALGGEARVTLDAYDYHDEPANRTVTVGYSVELVDVGDRIGELIAEELERVAGERLDAEERRVLGDRIAAAHVDQVTLSIEQSGGTTEGTWDVRLSDTGSILTGLVEIRGTDAGPWAPDYDDVAAALDAKEAAEFSETATWSIDTERDGDSIAVEATVRSEAENWTEYVAELERENRQPLRGTATIEQAATLGDDGVMQYTAAAETTDPALAMAAIGPPLSAVGVDAERSVFGVAPAGQGAIPIDGGRLTAAIDDGTVTIETGALAVGPEAPRLTLDDDPVAGVLFEPDGEGTSVTVVIEDTISADDADDRLRDHPRIGPETTIVRTSEHLLPEHDVTTIQDFVGTQDEPAELSPVDGGIVLAILGLVGTIGLRARGD